LSLTQGTLILTTGVQLHLCTYIDISDISLSSTPDIFTSLIEIRTYRVKLTRVAMYIY